MTNALKVGLLVSSIILIIVLLILILKRKISIKYAMIWFVSALIILVLSVFPNLFYFFSKLIGFHVMSNFIIALFILILLLITLVLTIIITYQKSQIVLLIQEISLLKNKVETIEKSSK